MQFVYTKLSRPEKEIMLCKVLSEFPKYVLPLPRNICINVTSWDGLINIQITAAVSSLIRLRACVKAKGGHFEHRVIQFFSLDRWPTTAWRNE